MIASALKVITENWALRAAWSATSQVTTLPAPFLGDDRRRRRWRAADAVLQRVVLQLEGAKAVQGLAVVDGNLTEDAVVTVEGNTENAWPGAFTESLPVWVVGPEGVLAWFLEAPQAYEWWRWTFEDPGNPTGVIEAGLLVHGPVLDFADVGNGFKGPRLGVRYERLDPSPVGRTRGGTPQSFALAKRTRLAFSTNHMSRAWAFEQLLPALEVAGTTRDMVLSMYAGDPGGDTAARWHNLYGRWSRLPVLDTIAHGRAADLEFEESR
jgi:hypothetical protein